MDSMEIIVKTMPGKTITLIVKASYTILEVKTKLREEQHVEPHQQRLIFAGPLMNNSRTLPDYGIKSGNTIYWAAKIKIQIMPYKRQNFELEVWLSSTMDNLKDEIQQQTGIAAHMQDLVCSNGKTPTSVSMLSNGMAIFVVFVPEPGWQNLNVQNALAECGQMRHHSANVAAAAAAPASAPAAATAHATYLLLHYHHTAYTHVDVACFLFFSVFIGVFPTLGTHH